MKITIFYFLSILFLLVYQSCGDDVDETGSSASSSSSLHSQLTQYVPLSQPTLLEHPIVVGMAKTNYSGGYMIVEKRYRATRGFSEQLALDPTTDVIWPGSIIKGSTIRSGEYTPIVGKRGPVTISISLENIKGDKYRNVSDAKLSKIRQAIANILAKKVTGATPARVSFTIEEVHSKEHFMLALGAAFDSGVHSVKGQFDFSNDAVVSRVLVKFMQVYYTIDIDIPQFPADFFDPDADWGYLLSQMAGSSPVYVSTVSYGRMALFSFESCENIETLKNAINYSCNGILASASGNVALEYKRVLNGSTIKALILGGDGAQAVTSINGFEGLKRYITTGGNYDKNSPAAPLAYKLRYLANNAIANIVLCSEYVVQERVAVSRAYKVYDIFLECLAEDDAGNEAEFYGHCAVTAFTPNQQIQGYYNGVQVDSSVWDVGSGSAWGMGSGATRYFGKEIVFSLEPHQVESASLKIGGWLKESDTFGDDNLGTYYVTLSLKDSSDKIYYVEGFSHGGTRARIGFKVKPIW